MTTADNRSFKTTRFKVIAEKRTWRILDSLRLLGQCANRRSYEYTDAQVEKIFREIRRALREAEQRFKDSKGKIIFNL